MATNKLTDSNQFPEEVLDRIKQLSQKYEAMGQDLASYLEGLLHADYLKYWEYIHLDTLLSLQHPKTNFADEPIFIMYHQITELYFKLIINELTQACDVTRQNAGPEDFLMRLRRVNRYFRHLSDSFDIMVDGMEQQQFLKFRMALLPSSGFQSAQYRQIEILSTDFIRLVAPTQQAALQGADVPTMYENLYWKAGATELATGNKTLTLRHFEEKYGQLFLNLAQKYQGTNLWQTYHNHYRTNDAGPMATELRQYDTFVNIFWPLAHYKSAVRYLQRKPEDIAATGGTNWQQYLPPHFQRIIFYPELWSADEQQAWGRKWVFEQVGKT